MSASRFDLRAREGGLGQAGETPALPGCAFYVLVRMRTWNISNDISATCHHK